MNLRVRAALCIALAGSWLVSSAPSAGAKCCPLEYVVVSPPSGPDVRIPASDLEDRLQDWEMQLVSWPVLNGAGKGDEPPSARLGPRYLVTYVHSRADGGEVTVRERVYPFAEPRPVAFTPKGQTQDWGEGDWDARAVEWGWRPLQPSIVDALLVSGPGRPTPGGHGMSWIPIAGGAGLLAAAAVAVRRRRTG